ncbi:HAD family hydrolase [Puniceicoccaceae bacterium K14]|nr:HAD family hydrolase [Puniceicoccaceae bacterium K14]
MALNPNFNQETIKGVLIDLDGTLLDHLSVISRCYEYAAEKMGYTAPTFEEVKRAIGGSMPVTTAKFFKPEHVEDAIGHWREHFEDIYLEDVHLMPGAMDLLINLQKLEIPAAVFTNKSGRHSRSVCESLGATPYLKFVLGTEDTEYRKPQPEFSQIALEKLGVDASQTIMIGDSPFDIQAATSVGMTSFTVPTGSHTKDELISSGSDRAFNNLKEIADQVFPDLCHT